MKIENGFIIPVPPVAPYDPFEYYFGESRATRYTKSLHYEFLAVQKDDPAAVVSFCSRYGTPGLSMMDENGFAEAGIPSGPLLGPPFKNTYLTSMPLHFFYGVQAGLRATIDHLQSVPSVPPLAFDDTIKKWAYRSPERYIAESFDETMHDVRLMPEWDGQKGGWIVRWSARTLTSIMYLMVLLDLQGPGYIRTCPRCTSPFTTYDERTRFCSPRCQNAAKQERHREKSKATTAKAKGRGPSHGKKKR